MIINPTEVLVTGTFNVLHPGHVRLLEFASRYGKVTVCVNADAYLEKKYGTNAIALVDRTYVLNSCKYVDKVVMFKEDEPSNLILKLKPRYYIKGPDYSSESLPELPAIQRVNSTLVIHPADKEYNSSDLVETLPSSAFRKVQEYC